MASKDYVAIATQYAQDVVEGKIATARTTQLACQRQLRDLKRTDWQWKFDEKRANKFCMFAELMPHVKGRWGSKTIKLEPWQCFQFSTIFGWVDQETGFRRFRKALIVVPRKNSKSTCGAIVGNYLLTMDGEPGPEVYSAATTRDQAKMVWETAKNMVVMNPKFKAALGVEPQAHSIMVRSTGGLFKPLSRDADTLEGLNPSGTIIDELHAHKTREVFDVLNEASGARKQPLIYIISTEGDNPTGILSQQIEYLDHILEERKEDERFFGIVYTIDKEDDWQNPKTWCKANPNLGVSVFMEDMESRCKEAAANPGSLFSFLTKRLNVRAGAGESYFNIIAWKNLCKNPEVKIEDFYGKECFIGLDLASKSDIAAKIILFAVKDCIYVFGKYYLPEDAIDKDQPNYDVYRGWADQNRLTLTPGNIIDFEFIERDLIEDSHHFVVNEVGYDPHRATELATRLMNEGLTLVPIPQNYQRLSEPMKDIASKIISGKVIHNGDPIMDWMISNVIPKWNAREDVMPAKLRNPNKIDGAVAMIMANSRALVAQSQMIQYSGLRSVG